MLTRMYLYSTSTKLSIDVWLYLDRPGSLTLHCLCFGYALDSNHVTLSSSCHCTAELQLQCECYLIYSNF